MLLSDEEITNLIAEYPTHSDKWLMVREAVRMTAERCAQICEGHIGYASEERAADACAAEIRERIIRPDALPRAPTPEGE